MDDIPHPPTEALALETYVEQRRGRWEVSVVVVYADRVVRHVISDHHNERLAQISASWIKRAADRDPPWLQNLETEHDE